MAIWNPRLHPRDPRNGQFIDAPDFIPNIGPLNATVPRGGEPNPMGNQAAGSKVRSGSGIRGFNAGVNPLAGNARAGVSVGPVRTSARIGLRSQTVSVGKDFRISPNYRVHVAALARLENVSSQRTYMQKLQTRVLRQLAGYLPTRKLRRMAEDVINQKAQSQTRGARSSSGRSFGETNFRTTRGTTAGTRVAANRRSPNRKPRYRSLQGTRVG